MYTKDPDVEILYIQDILIIVKQKLDVITCSFLFTYKHYALVSVVTAHTCQKNIRIEKRNTQLLQQSTISL